MIDWHAVRSQAATHVGYDPDTRRVWVRYKSDPLHQHEFHDEASPEEFTRLLGEESIGKALHKRHWGRSFTKHEKAAPVQ
jgi:hypothetical protein